MIRDRRDPSQQADPTGSASAVSAAGLSYSYPSRGGAVHALRDVTLQVARGEWVAVMGPSGSGKSTLLLCAAGLLRPSGGTVEIDGVDVGTASDRRLTEMRRTSVGFVFQEYNLVPALTVADNVALPAMFGGKRPDASRVAAVLEDVGLSGLGRRRPESLSGGQRQRVAIARALLARPTVLFADEPTGALDIASGEQVLGAVEGLVEHGTSVLMVTHDPRVAARAHRVIWLVDGEVVGEAQAAESEQIAAELAELERARS
jgi:putative ABC transport system ATP-binding protein